jgi:phospholipase C
MRPYGSWGGDRHIADLKHVVTLMQENRSFEHCYGNLQVLPVRATARSTAPPRLWRRC